MQNPIVKPNEPEFTETLRPRGLTDLQNTITTSHRKMFMALGFILFASMINFILGIVGNELTKEIEVRSGSIVGAGGDRVHVGQSVLGYDFTDLMLMNDTSDVKEYLSSMDKFSISVDDGFTRGYRVESWYVSDEDGAFGVNTPDNHTLAFNGTHLDFDDMTLATLEDEETPGSQRHLLGFWKKVAKKVKKKLDSPYCNTEALIDKVRNLKFATMPACHVGVSAAKIYMHYY